MVKRIFKGLIRLLLGLCIVILLFFIYLNLDLNPSPSPQLSFYYSDFIDNYICPDKISPHWKEAFALKKPQLIDKWYSLGPKLLSETTAITGRPFSYSKLSVPLFLCPTLPGFSFPIMVPAYMFLHSAVNPPWDESEFVDMVYHEMLHLYVLKALHWNLWTPLLRQYQSEDLNTRLHLHLYALQKTVYRKLGMENQWRKTVYRARQLPPSYARAIKIVNEVGADKFIAELKGLDPAVKPRDDVP